MHNFTNCSFSLRFNKAQKKSRTVIENTIGNWKERFQILIKPIRHAPKKSSDIITVTACLNNFAIDEGDMWCKKEGVFTIEPHDPRDNYQYYDPAEVAALNSGKKERDDLVANYFSRP